MQVRWFLPSVLYQVHEGVEVSESQDQQFAGRVQSDKDVLREGRLRLHVSRLRPEDSGLYLCEVKTDYEAASYLAFIWTLSLFLICVEKKQKSSAPPVPDQSRHRSSTPSSPHA
uniref:Ig-like domain-containing protein n=1 Tax=Nothobranchius furzeri TaxID=105023 RepID=A0A8C6KJB8_NOTFU